MDKELIHTFIGTYINNTIHTIEGDKIKCTAYRQGGNKNIIAGFTYCFNIRYSDELQDTVSNSSNVGCFFN